MIEGGWNTESAVDACIVIRRYAGNSLRLQKGDQLIVPDIEKDVPKAPAFLNLYRICSRVPSRSSVVGPM
jgi:hypothetical protein